MISTYELRVGNFVIEKNYSQFVQMKKELTRKTPHEKYIQSDKTNGGIPTSLNFISDINNTKFSENDRLIGDCPLVVGGIIDNEPIASDTLVNKRLIYNFDFWFTRDIGNALPYFSS